MKPWVAPAIICLLLWGVWGFLPKLSTRHLDPKSILVYEMIGNFTVGIFMLCWLGFRPDFNLPGAVFGFLTGVAALSGAFFYLLAARAGSISLVSTFTALYPVVTVMIAVFFLKEPLTLRQAAGMFLAVGAIYLVSS